MMDLSFLLSLPPALVLSMPLLLTPPALQTEPAAPPVSRTHVNLTALWVCMQRTAVWRLVLEQNRKIQIQIQIDL